MNAGSKAQQEALLPPIALGEVVATLAFTEPNGRWDASGIEMTATAVDGGKFRLDGAKSFVLDGHTADLIVVAARAVGTSGHDGLSLFTVPGDAPGLTRRALKVMDPTRKLARLEFEAVEADLLGELGGAAGPLSKTLTQAAACLASEMVGGAERLRVSALDYANLRMQFGRPIASFQSMKHKQADMLVDVELAKSAAYAAASAAAEDDPELPAIAALAKACASEAYLQTAINTIQIHGGIGFTWDNDTHLWFKRAKSSEVFLGDPAWHRERMLQAWGVGCAKGYPRRPRRNAERIEAVRRTESSPFPLAGKGRGWGVSSAPADLASRSPLARHPVRTPTPDPSPQGGGEQIGAARAADLRDLRGSHRVAPAASLIQSTWS